MRNINLCHLCFRSLRQRQSQDGAEGDHLQLEEKHQQHQGCVWLQGENGIVSSVSENKDSWEKLNSCLEREFSESFWNDLLSNFPVSWTRTGLQASPPWERVLSMTPLTRTVFVIYSQLNLPVKDFTLVICWTTVGLLSSSIMLNIKCEVLCRWPDLAITPNSCFNTNTLWQLSFRNGLF